MAAIPLEIVIIFLLILTNGVLALAEIAIVASRKARLQQKADEGDARSKAALELSQDPNEFLAAIQIGITLIGILAGAFSGATLAESLASWIARLPALAPFANALAIGIVVVVITYFSLVFGELVPKRLGLTDPEGMARRVAGPMMLLARIGRPLVRLLSASTDLVMRLLGVRPSDEPPVTEEEIKVMLEQGTQAGVFEASEQDMVTSIFRLGDRRVGGLMTPRTEVVWLDLEDPPDTNRDKIIQSVYSRLPVAKGDLDHIRGVLQAKTLLSRCLCGEPFDLEHSLVQPLFVPESMLVFEMIEQFRVSRLHTAMVVDEFGGIQGLVTLTDVLEAIIGEMPMPGELDEPGIVLREDGSWLLDGLLPVDEFMELLGVSEMPDLDRGYYQTLSGFVMNSLERIPTAGDHFEWNDLRFEVMDMDGKRVDKVLVVPLTAEQ